MIRGAARFKPDMYRSSLETTVAGLDPSATPPSGAVYMPVQLVAYDDQVVTGQNYVPGDPATEKNITILYEDTLQMALEAFDGKTQNQASAMWQEALESWRDAVAPAGPNLLKAIRSARLSPPSILP